MKLKLLTAVAATAILAVPVVAQADGNDEDRGWYLRGNAGYGTHTDIDHTGIITGDTESEGNAAFSLGLGYDFGENWRVELDGSSLWTDMGQVSQVPNTFSKLRTNALMANALYDFDEFGNWEPYVGAGFGKIRNTASVEANGLFGSQGAFISNPTCVARASCSVVNANDSAWAWQVIAGLGYDISDRLTWDTQYRYLDSLEDLDFDGVTTSRGFIPDGVGQVTMENVGAHMLMTGVRYRFGKASAPKVTCWNGDTAKMLADCPAQPRMITCWDGSSYKEGDGGTCPPEPAPVRYITCWDGSSYEEGSAGSCPPEPQPVTEIVCWDGSTAADYALCPAQPQTRSGELVTSLCENEYRQEIIYYEFDRGQSPETRATINRILDIGEFCQVENIQVVGHTDTSGSAAYNLQLSERRAKDAKDELVRQGINSTVISSKGMGETQPFVPTGDGVKEQLNRRTEVLIKLIQAGAYTIN